MPSSPGVYWFLDSDDNVLYVGKAKNIKNRVRSYTQYQRLSTRIQQMITTAVTLKHEVLTSELEALLVEAELIRTYQPPFNILLKDDKSNLYIRITKDIYPRVEKVRKREIIIKHLDGTILGPFPSAYKVTEVLKIARSIFKWCNKKPSKSPQNAGPCFYYHLDLCPGACAGTISPDDYAENIKDLVLFLKGKKQTVIKNLEIKMKAAVASEAFEKAATLRDQIRLIEEVTKQHYRLKPEMTLPVLQLSETQNAITYLRKILSTYAQLPAQYPLDRIEGYDVSNTQGTNPAVAMVTFTNGSPEKTEYRLFNIRSLNTPNDYHMMKEALIRRQNHPEWGKPNLVVVDGGKGQIRAALSIWEWNIPVIGIAKRPDRIIIPDIEFHSPKKLTGLKYHIIELEETHPTLKLIQQIRDEAHRFSKKQHDRMRTKNALPKS
ncbi:MAG: GIY-YIG nuclease family protein [Pseudomonadales bacterium]|nr:GIY-YIG nuclease family protein [Candidatus Woesebacteria bacterium]MCB9800589.1 GIY-YIG nuclease family protein [Pseudomonadales bacterium]